MRELPITLVVFYFYFFLYSTILTHYLDVIKHMKRQVTHYSNILKSICCIVQLKNKVR